MIKTIIESKSILENYLQNNNHVNTNDLVSEALTFLENAAINKDILQETRLGKVVNEFRKRTNDPNLSKRAKELVKGWRKFLVVEDSSRTTPLAGGGQGSSPSAAQTKRTSQPVSSPLCSSASSSPCLPRSANNGTKALPPHVNNLVKSRPPPSQTFKPVSPATELTNKTSVVHPKPYSSSHPSNQIKNSPHSLFNGTLSNEQHHQPPKTTAAATHPKFNGNHLLHNKSSSPRSSHFSSEGSSFRNFKPFPPKSSISSSKVASPISSAAAHSSSQSSPALPDAQPEAARGKRKLERSPPDKGGEKRARLNCRSPNSLPPTPKTPVLQRHRPNGPSVPKPYDGHKLPKSCAANSTGSITGSSSHSQKLQAAPQAAATPKVSKVKTTKEIIKDLCAKKTDTYTLSLVNRIASSATANSLPQPGSRRRIASPHVPSNRPPTSPCTTPPLTEVPPKKTVDEEIAEILGQLPPIDRASINLEEDNTEEEEAAVHHPEETAVALAADSEDLKCKRIPGINGNYDHLGEWRELYEVLESSVTDDTTIKILPYVIID